ncbi:MAG TPA: amylo-alpha-1,6-glucosidase [Puia sp.]|nr:amylo-alpha-1,6-glucosidase [Puia sp.]
MKRSVLFLPAKYLFAFLMTGGTAIAQPAKPLYRNDRFALYGDSVVQGQYRAKILSSGSIVSDYQSPANLYKSAAISFKFSINGRDNEMVSGTDHHFTCLAQDGACTTPLIRFGTALQDAAAKDNLYLKPNTKFTVRVDMRQVFDAFDKQGYYTTFNGDRIYKADFKGVYIAGNTAPLIWDFDNLVNHPQLQLKDEGDHIYSTTLTLNAQQDDKKTNAQWALSKDIQKYPQYKSPYPVSDALYNLSLEEMVNAIEPDSTFRTGKEWAGVWTRDISYSIILSMAWLQPRVAMHSLMRKVNAKKRIIQDTGTGGAWPCSTDRVIWAVAAFEVYKATGDKEWLRQAYTIIRNSIEDDEHIAYDVETGLVRGESSFLDWREQTYPKWMQPADIYESECLGTNAVHYKANEVLAEMATLLQEPALAAKHRAIANRIKQGINKYLWMPDKGYYAQYLYGRENKIVSPRSEALGEALCVIWDIADARQRQEILARTPMTDFGITCIYPQIPDIPPYHNNAVWSFVQSYFALAAQKAGNERALIQSIADIYRPAALFATNKENFVAENGDFAGTQINSSNMLWSLSGNISLVHRILFGLEFEDDALQFHPFVPEALQGERTLNNFRYRNAVLHISVLGFGNRIASFKIDGRASALPAIPATLTGRHTVDIQLANNRINSNVNEQPLYFSLPAPVASLDQHLLQWKAVQSAVSYTVIRNGKPVASTVTNSYAINKNETAEYMVIAVDKHGLQSFASEPVMQTSDRSVQVFQVEQFAPASGRNYSGFTGNGFVEISRTINRSLSFSVDIKRDGIYSIDFRYANGNGPTNTENKCAIRSLYIDHKETGAVVFPQRGKEEWSNWGYSNAVKARLSKGRHVITLDFEDFDDNMNPDINQAMIDQLRLINIP